MTSKSLRERLDPVVCPLHPESDWYREVREAAGGWEAWAICWADKKEIAMLASGPKVKDLT